MYHELRKRGTRRAISGGFFPGRQGGTDDACGALTPLLTDFRNFACRTMQNSTFRIAAKL
jgi:hypothetical protein